MSIDPEVPRPGQLDEDDLLLANALQATPRATWSELGHVLGPDAVTLARRWERLQSNGLAWVTPALGPGLLYRTCRAFVEIHCEPGGAAQVAAELSREPHLLTIQHVAGTYDLFAIAFTPDFPSMSDYLLTGLPRHEGVVRVRSHLVTRNFRTGSQWRLGVLNQRQERALRSTRPEPHGAETVAYSNWERDLIVALSDDGRLRYTDIATRLGVTPRTAQRRLNRLLGNRDLLLRCDVARPLAGWPTGALLWLNVPDELLEEAGRTLGAFPETRSCAALSGASNLLVTVTLHSVDALHDWAVQLRQALPYAEIADRSVVLRQDKLCGHLLDGWGRSRGVVPLDIWRPSGLSR
ncbi:Lrp/AsnC family transcriptional regulator [Streptomyces decoyicus]